MSFYKEESRDGEARTGKLFLPSDAGGTIEVETPCFMPVGTRASVKGLWQEDLEEIGYRLILGNTYHLYLRPGSSQIRELGGLGRFMSWSGALLTDSGGYQMFSLSDRMQLDLDGVNFKSHLDGSEHRFTPESAIDIQTDLRSHIMMVLDDCPPADADEARIQASLVRTHTWAKRSIDHHNKLCEDGRIDPNRSRMFGIVQGGTSQSARAQSLQAIGELPFSGVAVGGLSVGESRESFYDVLNFLGGRMDPGRPRYLMGVGTVPDFIEAVRNGFDMFDCVLPTRNARNGQGLTSQGKLRIRNQSYKNDESPLDPACECRVCRRYSRAYIRHLFMSDEMLGPQLMSFHNLAFFYTFMEEMRGSIRAGRFATFYLQWKEWDKNGPDE